MPVPVLDAARHGAVLQDSDATRYLNEGAYQTMHYKRQTLHAMMKEREIGQKIREFFRAWAQSRSGGAGSAGEGPHAYQYLDFQFRPNDESPQVRLAFYANMHEGQPVIHVVLPPDPSASAATGDVQTIDGQISAPPADTSVSVTPLFADVPDTREHDAICEGCGTIGTIGRATRTHESGSHTETHRFCANCWVEQSARYRARWDEERRISWDAHRRSQISGPSGPSYWSSFESSTWHGVLDLVTEVARHISERGPIPVTQLSALAELYKQNAHRFEGEMPLDVELFIKQYAPPSS